MYGETFYGRHMVDVRGRFTAQTPAVAAVKSNKNQKWVRSFKSNENIHKKEDINQNGSYSKRSFGCIKHNTSSLRAMKTFIRRKVGHTT